VRPAIAMNVLLAALLCAGLACAAGLPLAAQAAPAPDVEARYRDAAAAFHALRSGGPATPEQWRAVAERFQAIHADVPQTRRGADALYSAALAGREAWRVSAEWRDLSRAASTFRDYAGRYASDRLADDALMHLAALLSAGYTDLPAAREAYRRLIHSYPDGDQHPAAQERLAAVESALAAAQAQERAAAVAQAAQRPAPAAPLKENPLREAEPARPELSALAASTVTTADEEPAPKDGGHVRGVQFWSALEWTRVIITTDPGVRYTVNRLGPDETRPQRVYFDLQGAQPADDLAAVTAVNDAVLAQIRAGRYDDATTRVVLDLKAMQRFEVKDFRLPGERKIVVDVYPTEAVLAAARRKVAPVPVPRLASVPVVPAAPARPAALTAQTQQPAPRPARADAPAPQPTPAANRLLPEPLVNVPVGLQVRSIMIDPGHGGHDPGALGYGTAEKDLTLAISRKLRQLLHERHPALRVGMTRDSDAFIALQERPLIAKRFGADLFVSVHLNANPNRRFHGVETYFLNLTQDRDALQVAARENGTSEQRLSDLNDILLDLLRDSNLIESGELAKAVQASLVGTLRAEHGPVRDLGVKQAPFLVLMGAEMPSVLVEAGFVTNREEHGRLQDPDYLNRIAEGIYDGLRRYIEQQNIIATDHPAGPLAANDRP